MINGTDSSSLPSSFGIKEKLDYWNALGKTENQEIAKEINNNNNSNNNNKSCDTSNSAIDMENDGQKVKQVFYSISQSNFDEQESIGDEETTLEPKESLLTFGPLLIDKKGDGTHSLKIPPNIVVGKRYSFHVFGASKDKFGYAKHSLIVRSALKIHLTAPKFVYVGDTFYARIVIDCFTHHDKLVMDVTSSNREKIVPASNKFDLFFENEQKKGAVNVLFQVKGSPFELTTETITVTIELENGTKYESKASIGMEWPVRDENLRTCRIVQSGMITSKEHVLSVASADLTPNSGLQVEVCNSQFMFLKPSIEWLWNCSSDYLERISSRVLGLCSVYNHLECMGLKSTKEEIELQLYSDVNQLLEFQGALGGFGLWSRHSISSSFLSTHAAHALWETNQLNCRVQVSAASLDRCRTFVDSASRAPVTTKKDIRARAYASYVGVKMGACVVSAAQAKFVAMEDDHCDLDTLGWLLCAVCLSLKLLDMPKKKNRFASFWGLLSGDSVSKERVDALDAIVRRMCDLLDGKIATTPEINVYSSHFDYLFSETRGLAVAFEGLQRVIEESNTSQMKLEALNAKKLEEIFVKINAKRNTNGTWATVHETCFCCISLARYLSSVEAEKLMGIEGSLELISNNDGSLFESSQNNSNNNEKPLVQRICVPYEDLVDSDNNAMEMLIKSQASYFSITLDRMHPTVSAIYPVSSGFHLTRNFEFIDNEEDIKFDEKGQKYVVKLGARLHVRLTFSPDMDSSFQVLLRDHFGAGLEVVNKRMIGASTGGKWHDYLSVKKNSLEVFADRLTGKTERSFTYVVQAVCLGSFTIPPAYICELYKRDVFGRSRSCKVEVK